MFKHILIPTDGSSVAAKAIQAGVALAGEMGAKVTGFCAEEPPPHRYKDGLVVPQELHAELERRSRECAERNVAEIEKAARTAASRSSRSWSSPGCLIRPSSMRRRKRNVTRSSWRRTVTVASPASSSAASPTRC